MLLSHYSSQAHQQFCNHGHNLANNNYTAWYAACDYAKEIGFDKISIIEKATDKIYEDYLARLTLNQIKVGQELFNIAIKNIGKKV